MTVARAQLDGLTGLRGLAAWLVVFYHIQSGIGGWMPPLAGAAFAKGYLAVDLFFILSGFVIWLNYADWFTARGWSGYGPFLQKRLARIWPLHAFVLVLMALLGAALALSGRPTGVDYPWSELPLHFALLQNWGFTDTLSWNHPAWSISTEFGAYIAFPLLVLVAKPDRWHTAGLIAAIIGLCALIDGLFIAAGGGGLGSDIPGLGLLRCLCQFAIGCLLCIIWTRTSQQQAPRIATVAALGFAVMSGLWYAGAMDETRAFPLAAASLILCLALCDGARLNLLRWRPIVWLGEISYSTYLVHFLAWRVFKLLFVSDAAAVSPLQTVFFIALLLAGSAISYRLIEQPGRRFFAGIALKRPKAMTPA